MRALKSMCKFMVPRGLRFVKPGAGKERMAALSAIRRSLAYAPTATSPSTAPPR
jgi:hypothetical protein